MVSSLIEHERIVTTVAKAKEIRHLAEQMITLAKKGGSLQQQGEVGGSVEDDETSPVQQSPASPTYLHNRRRAAEIVRGDDKITKLFEVLGPRYAQRQGGYTRIMKLAKPRHGDNAPMAVIEYVDRPGEIRAARPPSRSLSDMLQEMGISPIDELVPPDELEQMKAQVKSEEEAAVEASVLSDEGEGDVPLENEDSEDDDSKTDENDKREEGREDQANSQDEVPDDKRKTN